MIFSRREFLFFCFAAAAGHHNSHRLPAKPTLPLGSNGTRNCRKVFSQSADPARRSATNRHGRNRRRRSIQQSPALYSICT
jgi:hypothetical protein